jgi:hypothetical protein
MGTYAPYRKQLGLCMYPINNRCNLRVEIYFYTSVVPYMTGIITPRFYTGHFRGREVAAPD